jgi:diguanylate cyclase (GGDEF)-like protein
VLRISIASRVSAACAVLLALSLLVVVLGLSAGAHLQAANSRIDRLTHLLRTQDREDSMQRQVRLAIGEITRDAEQRKPIAPDRWRRLDAGLRRFAARGAAPSDRIGTPPAVDAVLIETAQATRGFVPVARRLVTLAQGDPTAIKPAMPGFLAALKRLEASRTDAREALGSAIEAAIDANIRLTRSNSIRLTAVALATAVLLFLMTAWMRLRVITPIVAIAARLRDFDSDRPEAVAVPGLRRPDEIGDLARGLSEYRRVVEERRVAQRRIDFLAHHDALTGLPNRLLFEERLAHELRRSRRTGDQVAVFAIDMDGFKAINDRHGHAGGDDALRRAARLLAGCSRADDLVARIGGDEFAIVQAAAAQPQAAEALLARIAAALADGAGADGAGAEVAIRMSIGVAVAAIGQGGDDLCNAADIALYRAKSDGGNTARFYDTGLQDEIRLKRRLGRDLETAIERDQLYVVFQPIATNAMRIVGYEALLRWRHPELGEIAPCQFIPIAESTGQIGAIGRWMTDRALAAAAEWRPDLTLSLNLSPLQFREPDLAPAMLHLAERHGVAPGRLSFEVTESATLLGHHRDAVLATLRRLQDAGARIAMDDFGTGHSSLSNLKDFRFDTLKIDKSFVAVMLVDQPSASIIRATIGLGRSLGAVIVAEGVEHQRQLDALREWGCEQVQGYLIGRPAPTVAARARPARTGALADQLRT